MYPERILSNTFVNEVVVTTDPADIEYFMAPNAQRFSFRPYTGAYVMEPEKNVPQ